MTNIETMEEIKQLTLAYIHHNNESLFTSKHLKKTIAFDIWNNAQTPQQVLNFLHKKHGISPYLDVPRYQVLVMNRTPWWLWLIQAAVILITFPISIPFLMIWSWKNRGTVNFMRTDGSIYLEKVLNLCKKAGIEKPNLPSRSPPFSYFESTTLPDPSLNLGNNMPTPTASSHSNLLQVLGSPTNTTNTTDTSLTTTLPDTPSIEEETNKMLEGITRFCKQAIQVMRDNPYMFMDDEVMKSNGKAVITYIYPLERTLVNGKEEWWQNFKYASPWTKPWQELDEFPLKIKVFREFTFVRPLQKTDKLPTNILPPKCLQEKAYSMVLSFYKDDSKTLVQKAREHRGEGKSEKFYHRALEAAKNNEEYIDVMEKLINFYYEELEIFKEKSSTKHRYQTPIGERQLQERLRLKQNEIDECIDMLPKDYHQHSKIAQTLNAFFNDVWGSLEKTYSSPQEEIENNRQISNLFYNEQIKELIDSGFVQLALPHFVCMWHMLHGLFFIKGNYQTPLKINVKEVDQPSCSLHRFRRLLELLQRHQLVEAEEFEQKTLIPMEHMQAHAEQLFQQIPRKEAIQNARQCFKERREILVDGFSPSYKKNERGLAFPPEFELVTEGHRTILSWLEAHDTAPRLN
ncbi:hypothetical protein [Legionella yabuuchiae]|uniref:hypothetical protein n=1 Tax=Legionella yabuuchiae TaxID=376727 RepID=UPI001056CE42|nr:hypothetical protein [Legionella yabuuchiae]